LFGATAAAKRKARYSQQSRARFLGRPHSPEHRQAISLAMTGKRHSRESISKMRQIHIEHLFAGPTSCPCAAHKFPTSPTSIELLLQNVILAEFPEVVPQKRFGRFRVDAYLPPPYHLAFEADGEYWHRSKDRDETRDQLLLQEFRLPVVRLSESEIRKFVVVRV